MSFLLFGGWGPESVFSGHGPVFENSPGNATYHIENNRIQLTNGRTEWQAAPGSASRVEVSLFGETVYNDLNNDGEEDAVILLTYRGGGSGTFFYLAAALLQNGKYQGTNGIWLGDRIGFPNISVVNGIIIVELLDRRPDEPMTSKPMVHQTRYFILDQSALNEIIPAEGETIYQGWLTVGHEVRSFLPCDEKDELWLAGDSPALTEIIDAYRNAMTGSDPYTPVFAVLAGSRTASSEDGFGADYEKTLSASGFIHIWPEGNCRSNMILLDSPLPGANISSPLTIKGRARGPWFFEGDFPVALLDTKGDKVAEGYATARGEWMTDNFVNFESIIHFKGNFSGQKGTILLKKDNPTGLAKFDDFLEIPVIFNNSSSSLSTQKKNSPETVVLLHGLGRSARSMAYMQKRLIEAGYRVFNYEYESRKSEIGSLTTDFQEYFKTNCSQKESDLHFVTHSLGGILVRAFIAAKRPENLGRVVMLSPPNKGSETVDYLKEYSIFKKIFGPAAIQLSTGPDSFPNRLGPADFELGIITGDRTIDPVSSWIIPGKDDGKVAVERTKLEGMTDFLVVQKSHAYIMKNPDVVDEVIHFLQNGRFSTSRGAAPEKGEKQ